MTVLLASLILTQLRAKKANAWDLSVRYPRFSAAGPVAQKANESASARERKVFRDFLAQAEHDIPDLKRQGSAGTYQLEVKPHRIVDRPGLASGYVDRYDYLAGAHGTTRYEVVNYGLVEGRVRPLRIGDLFEAGDDAVGEASHALVAIMKAMKDAPSDVASEKWTRLTPEEADRFVVGKLGVLFLFDQYDVGYGAQGAPKILVPYAKLPGIDRNGVLAAVFR